METTNLLQTKQSDFVKKKVAMDHVVHELRIERDCLREAYKNACYAVTIAEQQALTNIREKQR